MALKDELEKQGRWLFRWRSYLPLIIFPILLIALRESEYLERTVGDFYEDLWEGLCVALSFIGLAIRCIVVGYAPEGTSGRNTKKQIAKTLTTTGMYSILRHPLYLGNFFIFLGIILFTQVWWFVLISTFAFWLYYERIMLAEEVFLQKKFGDTFLEWAEKTPTFLPKFKNWQQPTLAFSLKNILKREYTGFFVIIASFTLLEIIGDIFAEGRLELDLAWMIIFIVGLITYLTLRILKKKTKILNVEGR
ncbi:MAG: isoprenylcysteine carboxylmethyltransferase family protein [Nitrospirota bacterium]